uniref:Uncharacterized protein n=1 Tax=Solanum lycopersicum TaxID=4081 RepID=A0A3Q7IQ68_SOLLC
MFERTALEKPKPTSATGSVRADKTKVAELPWPRTILWRASNDVCFCSFTIASWFFHSYRYPLVPCFCTFLFSIDQPSHLAALVVLFNYIKSNFSDIS